MVSEDSLFTYVYNYSTFELFDHLVVVLQSSLHNLFRVIHLPLPFCTHWVRMVPGGTAECTISYVHTHVHNNIHTYMLMLITDGKPFVNPYEFFVRVCYIYTYVV